MSRRSEAHDEALHDEQPERAVQPPLDERKATVHDLAVKQSDERKKLAEHQAQARKGKEGVELEKLKLDQAAERTELEAKHHEKMKEADPVVAGRPVFLGIVAVEKVAKLHSDLTALAAVHHFDVGEIHNFGLDLEVFDHETGEVLVVAQGNRRNVGVPYVLMTASQVVADIEAGRVHLRATQ